MDNKTEPANDAGPDYAGACDIYTKTIAPAKERRAREGGKTSGGWTRIDNTCKVDKGAAKQAFKVSEMEPENRDIFLRDFFGILNQLEVGVSRDMVDAMEGKDQLGLPLVDRADEELLAEAAE